MHEKKGVLSFKSIFCYSLNAMLLSIMIASLASCGSSTDPPTVAFKFAVTDDSRAAGGGSTLPTPPGGAGFGQSNLAQNNGDSTAVMAAIAKDIAAQGVDFVLFPGDMITGEDNDPTHLSSE
ncbi:MAG: hypothetical protein L7F78_23745, partial [Syntrophales bacterium LBB04]|nr:hypothetical protein [Syntrophales bacterium LBB04]